MSDFDKMVEAFARHAGRAVTNVLRELADPGMGERTAREQGAAAERAKVAEPESGVGSDDGRPWDADLVSVRTIGELDSLPPQTIIALPSRAVVAVRRLHDLNGQGTWSVTGEVYPMFSGNLLGTHSATEPVGPRWVLVVHGGRS